MQELRCSECGGELFMCISNIDVSGCAEMKNYKRRTGGFIKWNRLISLSCYDCGSMFDICVGASDSEISELDGLYDFDSIDKKRYELHKKRIEAERLAFNPNIRRKQYVISKYGCDCSYPF